MLIELEAMVFYQIFKSTDKNWTTKITDSEIRTGLKNRISLNYIQSVRIKLIKEGVLQMDGDTITVKYTNTKLY